MDLRVDIRDESVTFYRSECAWLQSDRVESLGDWQ